MHEIRCNAFVCDLVQTFETKEFISMNCDYILKLNIHTKIKSKRTNNQTET